MSEVLAQSAKRLAAICAQVLGWSPDQFWAATPEELATALADPGNSKAVLPPSRIEIEKLMERDRNG